MLSSELSSEVLLNILDIGSVRYESIVGEYSVFSKDSLLGSISPPSSDSVLWRLTFNRVHIEFMNEWRFLIHTLEVTARSAACGGTTASGLPLLDITWKGRGFGSSATAQSAQAGPWTTNRLKAFGARLQSQLVNYLNGHVDSLPYSVEALFERVISSVFGSAAGWLASTGCIIDLSKMTEQLKQLHVTLEGDQGQAYLNFHLDKRDSGFDFRAESPGGEAGSLRMPKWTCQGSNLGVDISLDGEVRFDLVGGATNQISTGSGSKASSNTDGAPNSGNADEGSSTQRGFGRILGLLGSKQVTPEAVQSAADWVVGSMERCTAWLNEMRGLLERLSEAKAKADAAPKLDPVRAFFSPKAQDGKIGTPIAPIRPATDGSEPTGVAKGLPFVVRMSLPGLRVTRTDLTGSSQPVDLVFLGPFTYDSSCGMKLETCRIGPSASLQSPALVTKKVSRRSLTDVEIHIGALRFEKSSVSENEAIYNTAEQARGSSREGGTKSSSQGVVVDTSKGLGIVKSGISKASDKLSENTNLLVDVAQAVFDAVPRVGTGARRLLLAATGGNATASAAKSTSLGNEFMFSSITAAPELVGQAESHRVEGMSGASFSGVTPAGTGPTPDAKETRVTIRFGGLIISVDTGVTRSLVLLPLWSIQHDRGSQSMLNTWKADIPGMFLLFGSSRKDVLWGSSKPAGWDWLSESVSHSVERDSRNVLTRLGVNCDALHQDDKCAIIGRSSMLWSDATAGPGTALSKLSGHIQIGSASYYGVSVSGLGGKVKDLTHINMPTVKVEASNVDDAMDIVSQATSLGKSAVKIIQSLMEKNRAGDISQMSKEVVEGAKSAVSRGLEKANQAFQALDSRERDFRYSLGTFAVYGDSSSLLAPRSGGIRPAMCISDVSLVQTRTLFSRSLSDSDSKSGPMFDSTLTWRAGASHVGPFSAKAVTASIASSVNSRRARVLVRDPLWRTQQVLPSLCVDVHGRSCVVVSLIGHVVTRPDGEFLMQLPRQVSVLTSREADQSPTRPGDKAPSSNSNSAKATAVLQAPADRKCCCGSALETLYDEAARCLQNNIPCEAKMGTVGSSGVSVSSPGDGQQLKRWISVVLDGKIRFVSRRSSDFGVASGLGASSEPAGAQGMVQGLRGFTSRLSSSSNNGPLSGVASGGILDRVFSGLQALVTHFDLQRFDRDVNWGLGIRIAGIDLTVEKSRSGVVAGAACISSSAGSTTPLLGSVVSTRDLTLEVSASRSLGSKAMGLQFTISKYGVNIETALSADSDPSSFGLHMEDVRLIPRFGVDGNLSASVGLLKVERMGPPPGVVKVDLEYLKSRFLRTRPPVVEQVVEQTGQVEQGSQMEHTQPVADPLVSPSEKQSVVITSLSTATSQFGLATWSVSAALSLDPEITVCLAQAPQIELTCQCPLVALQLQSSKAHTERSMSEDDPEVEGAGRKPTSSDQSTASRIIGVLSVPEICLAASYRSGSRMMPLVRRFTATVSGEFGMGRRSLSVSVKNSLCVSLIPELVSSQDQYVCLTRSEKPSVAGIATGIASPNSRSEQADPLEWSLPISLVCSTHQRSPRSTRSAQGGIKVTNLTDLDIWVSGTFLASGSSRSIDSDHDKDSGEDLDQRTGSTSSTTGLSSNTTLIDTALPTDRVLAVGPPTASTNSPKFVRCVVFKGLVGQMFVLPVASVMSMLPCAVHYEALDAGLQVRGQGILSPFCDTASSEPGLAAQSGLTGQSGVVAQHVPSGTPALVPSDSLISKGSEALIYDPAVSGVRFRLAIAAPAGAKTAWSTPFMFDSKSKSSIGEVQLKVRVFAANAGPSSGSASAAASTSLVQNMTLRIFTDALSKRIVVFTTFVLNNASGLDIFAVQNSVRAPLMHGRVWYIAESAEQNVDKSDASTQGPGVSVTLGYRPDASRPVYVAKTVALPNLYGHSEASFETSAGKKVALSLHADALSVKEFVVPLALTRGRNHALWSALDGYRRLLSGLHVFEHMTVVSVAPACTLAFSGDSELNGIFARLVAVRGGTKTDIVWLSENETCPMYIGQASAGVALELVDANIPQRRSSVMGPSGSNHMASGPSLSAGSVSVSDSGSEISSRAGSAPAGPQAASREAAVIGNAQHSVTLVDLSVLEPLDLLKGIPVFLRTYDGQARCVSVKLRRNRGISEITVHLLPTSIPLSPSLDFGFVSQSPPRVAEYIPALQTLKRAVVNFTEEPVSILLSGSEGVLSIAPRSIASTGRTFEPSRVQIVANKSRTELVLKRLTGNFYGLFSGDATRVSPSAISRKDSVRDQAIASTHPPSATSIWSSEPISVSVSVDLIELHFASSAAGAGEHLPQVALASLYLQGVSVDGTYDASKKTLSGASLSVGSYQLDSCGQAVLASVKTVAGTTSKAAALLGVSMTQPVSSKKSCALLVTMGSLSFDQVVEICGFSVLLHDHCQVSADNDSMEQLTRVAQDFFPPDIDFTALVESMDPSQSGVSKLIKVCPVNAASLIFFNGLQTSPLSCDLWLRVTIDRCRFLSDEVRFVLGLLAMSDQVTIDGASINLPSVRHLFGNAEELISETTQTYKSAIKSSLTSLLARSNVLNAVGAQLWQKTKTRQQVPVFPGSFNKPESPPTKAITRL